MFPKPIAPHVGNMGVITAASVPQESYTGGHYLNLTIDNPHVDDVQQWQYSTDGGTSWSSTLSRASALAVTYSTSNLWRVRLTNASFAQTGPWFTLANATYTRIGPASSPVAYGVPNINKASIVYDGTEEELEFTASFNSSYFLESANIHSRQLAVVFRYNDPSLNSTTCVANEWHVATIATDVNMTNSAYARVIATGGLLVIGYNLPYIGSPTPVSVSLEYRAGYVDGDFNTPGRYAAFTDNETP